MRYSQAYTHRHNAIVHRLKTALAKFTIIAENQTVVPNLDIRPDLLAVKDNHAFIIDVTIPFENRPEAFTKARETKMERYKLLQQALLSRYGAVDIVPFIVGSLGSWDNNNDQFLRLVCAKSYAKLFKKLCVVDCIKWSRDIYIEHLTNIPQYKKP